MLNEPLINFLFSVLVMGVIGFVDLKWMLNAGRSGRPARSVLLLRMILFENVHIEICCSENKSALKLSPFRCPIFLAGAISTFVVHFGMMYFPFGHAILGTEPVGPGSWFTLRAIALGLIVLVQLHKWTCPFRGRFRPRMASKPVSRVAS